MLDVHSPKHGRYGFEVDRSRPANLDLAARNRRHHCPTAGFDVVAPQLMLGATELRPPLDANRRRALADDGRAELAEKLAQLDDMRLARGMADAS